MVELTAIGSPFHKEGPMDAEDLNWAIEVLTRGTKRSSRSEDLRGTREMSEMGRRKHSSIVSTWLENGIHIQSIPLQIHAFKRIKCFLQNILTQEVAHKFNGCAPSLKSRPLPFRPVDLLAQLHRLPWLFFQPELSHCRQHRSFSFFCVNAWKPFCLVLVCHC